MKPQDIILLIKLHTWKQGRWKIVSLANSALLSPAETHAGIKRLVNSSLFDPVLEKVKKTEMEEFIIYGTRYCFPAEFGPISRGIPTAHSAHPLNKMIVAGGTDSYVWPHAEGKIRGISIKPLYKTAPDAALVDSILYEYLALIDALRIGKAREKEIAKIELIKLIKKGNNDEATAS